MNGEDKTNSAQYYDKHLFICINQRHNARSCSQGDSLTLQEYAKKKLRTLGLENVEKIRVNKSGCLGRCEFGPVAVVYPDGVWYAYRTREDLCEILSEHIVKNQIVERLRIPAEQTPACVESGCQTAEVP